MDSPDLRTPTEFTAKQFGPNVLFLLWCKASGPVTGYRVECFKDDSQSAEFIKDVPNVSQESLIIIGLQRNHTYRLGIASRTAEATNQPVFIEHRITDMSQMMDRLRKYMKFRSERCFSFKSGDQEETSNKYSNDDMDTDDQVAAQELSDKEIDTTNNGLHEGDDEMDLGVNEEEAPSKINIIIPSSTLAGIMSSTTTSSEQSQVVRVVVTQDYVPGHWPGEEGQNDDPSQHDYELTLHKGETLAVLEQTDSFTWLGYKDGNLGYFPSCCVQAVARVELTRNHWLRINEEGTKWKALSETSWTEDQTNIDPAQVQVITMNNVNVKGACRNLFNFISTCTQCSRLGIYAVSSIDDQSSSNNNELSCRLCEALEKLPSLLEVDIRNTEFRGQWLQVWSSISNPGLRVLILDDNNLCREGKQLKTALERFPQLRYLSLNNSRIGGKDILELICKLPSSCPLLQCLLIHGHDLSRAGDQLVQAFQGLTTLRLLVISRCFMTSFCVCTIVEQINTGIEILDIHTNDPITERKRFVFDHIKECKSLAYMHVSSSQISEPELYELGTILTAQGGSLLVDAGTKHDQWCSYVKHVTKIRDECSSS